MEGLLPLVFRTIMSDQRRADLYRNLSNRSDHSGRFGRSSSSLPSPHLQLAITPRPLVSDLLDDLPNSDLHHRTSYTSSTSDGPAAATAAAADPAPAVHNHIRRPTLEYTTALYSQSQSNESASGAVPAATAAADPASLRSFINPKPAPLLNPPPHAHNHHHVKVK